MDMKDVAVLSKLAKDLEHQKDMVNGLDAHIGDSGLRLHRLELDAVDLNNEKLCSALLSHFKKRLADTKHKLQLCGVGDA